MSNFTSEAIMTSSASNGKPLKKRVSIACVKCRDRKVKCIPAAYEEPARCTRCKEKNQPCQYMTVTAQSEQRGRLTTPEQTDYYPHYESDPVHPPPAPPSRPPPVDSTYSYPQQPFSNQSYPPSTYQNADHQNTPALSFSPPSNMSSAFQNANHQNAPSVGFSPPSNMSSAFPTAHHQNAPSVSFSPPSNMASVHQAFPPAPPRQAFTYAQPSSPIRSGQDTPGNYGTHAYFNSTYPQAQPTHQMPPNGQQFYQEWRQGNN